VKVRTHEPGLVILAALVILCVPGPSNTVLTIEGAAVGAKRGSHHLLGERGGYLVAIVTIGLVLRPLSSGSPVVSVGPRRLDGGCLITLAWSLRWLRLTTTTVTGDRIIRLRSVFITALFNPKALVVVLGTIRFGARRSEYCLARFLLLAAVAGTGWNAAGALLGAPPPVPSGGPRRSRL
jgi:threonine/homoserine/homoserine lactone efflux protein